MKSCRAGVARVARKVIFALVFSLAAIAVTFFPDGPNANAAPLPFLANHQLHDESEDIFYLQQLLNGQGFTVAPSGPGSVGNETPFFGLRTYRALVSFQSAHHLPATGFFGPMTRGLINSNYGASSASASTTNDATVSPDASLPVHAPTAPARYVQTDKGPVRISYSSKGGHSSSGSTPVPDTTAPTVSLTVPADGATLSGSSVTISANASDDVAAAGVQFRIAGANAGAEDTSSPYTYTWDTTGVADGTYRMVAVARDTSNNYATSTVVTVTVDNTAPVRSGGSPTGVLAFGTTATTLIVTTNETATCHYSASAGTSYASGIAFTTTGATSHSTSITGLQNATSYIYYVRCQDGQGNANASDFSISFSVAADTTSPIVSLTAPLSGDIVSGTSVSLAANASDDVSVSGVTFKVDGITIGSEDTTSAYTGTWDSTGVADGSHTLSAVARDGSGNLATSSVSVTVDNTAPVSSSISSGTPAATAATITWSTNEPATSRVVYGVTTSYGLASSSASLDTFHSIRLIALNPSTTYHYAVVSLDASGNTSTSSDRTFTSAAAPDVTPPVISAIASSTTTTTATITWTTDENSDSNVVYGSTSSYGSASTSAATTTSHSVTLTGLTSATTYHFAVVSTDGSGNTATSSDGTFATASTLSSGQLSTLARLQTAAASSLGNNPVDNADMASPPTVTISGSHDASLTASANPQANPTLFRASAGSKHVRTTTNGLYIGSSSVYPAASDLSFITSLSPALVNQGEEQRVYTVDFVVTGQVVELNLRVAGATVSYRIIVDDRFVARDGVVATSQFVKMDFGSSATRRITVEVETATEAFLGVATSAGGSITAPTNLAYKGIFYGDSITESSSSGETNFYIYDGWASTFSKKSGINSVQNAAVGGTGYTNNGSTRSKIGDQMDFSIASSTFDLVGFAAGFNDYNTSIPTMQSNALAAWQKARAAQPNALILVFGIFGETTGPSANLISAENALLSTFNAWGDPFSKFIPVSTDSSGAWITGTGYVGHTNGSGNSDTYISSDGLHPSRTGRIYLGGKANAAYRGLLPTIH
jgi:lysophospholipase L1-like esterase